MNIINQICLKYFTEWNTNTLHIYDKYIIMIDANMSVIIHHQLNAPTAHIWKSESAIIIIIYQKLQISLSLKQPFGQSTTNIGNGTNS